MGGTRPALDYLALKSIKIPLPPLPVQTEIVTHTTAIHNQTKQQVERMILEE